ncbi:hypothetical protein HK098_006193 [Nowakowskiella sp. JEL0407]|nr:hypothetical protein HK098_006193 [Nowakowskiella sp. JEL0407]
MAFQNTFPTWNDLFGNINSSFVPCLMDSSQSKDLAHLLNLNNSKNQRSFLKHSDLPPFSTPLPELNMFAGLSMKDVSRQKDLSPTLPTPSTPPQIPTPEETAIISLPIPQVLEPPVSHQETMDTQNSISHSKKIDEIPPSLSGTENNLKAQEDDEVSVVEEGEVEEGELEDELMQPSIEEPMQTVEAMDNIFGLPTFDSEQQITALSSNFNETITVDPLQTPLSNGKHYDVVDASWPSPTLLGTLDPRHNLYNNKRKQDEIVDVKSPSPATKKKKKKKKSKSGTSTTDSPQKPIPKKHPQIQRTPQQQRNQNQNHSQNHQQQRNQFQFQQTQFDNQHHGISQQPLPQPTNVYSIEPSRESTPNSSLTITGSTSLAAIEQLLAILPSSKETTPTPTRPFKKDPTSSLKSVMSQHVRDLHIQEEIQARREKQKLQKDQERKEVLKNIPCEYWKRGYCGHNDKCERSHAPEYFNISGVRNNRKPDIDLKTYFCKFWVSGSCVKGGMCEYSHDKATVPCLHYHLFDNCRKSPCEFSHADISEFRKKDLIAEREKRLNFHRMASSGDGENPGKQDTWNTDMNVATE